MSDIAALAARAATDDPRALGRLISVVESGGDAVREVAETFASSSGSAKVVGLTGAPGVGKSTTTSALVSACRAEGKKVAVLAIDPSSPFSGGAILGDRVRMQDHATDSGVYIRSMSSRGQLGGLAAATPQAVRVLEACGFDVILIETVGVGQAEVEITGLADSTLVLLAPGMGDGIQAVKAGILEIADVFVVNKADREGADATVRDIRAMMALISREPHQWRQPILKTSSHRGEGLSEVVEELDKHYRWLDEHGELRRRRQERAHAEVSAIVMGILRQRYAVPSDVSGQVVEGVLDPFTAADQVLGD